MIKLEEITWENWDVVYALEVTKEQENFIASNRYSLAESFVALRNDVDPPLSFAITNDRKVIGFTMMYHDSAEENEYGNDECYGICRFMIDKKYQGNGYGRESFKKILAFLKTFPQGKTNSVYLTYSPENVAAKSLYDSFGFIETGSIVDDEVVSKLVLSE